LRFEIEGLEVGRSSLGNGGITLTVRRETGKDLIRPCVLRETLGDADRAFIERVVAVILFQIVARYRATGT